MNYLDQEKRYNIIASRGFKCEVCGTQLTESNSQLAHKINQRKMYLKKYGADVIHHPLNLVATCSEDCNSSVSILGKGKLIEDLVKKIKNKIDNIKEQV